MKFILYPVIALAVMMNSATVFSQQKDYAGLNSLHKIQDKRTPGKTSFNKLMSGSATPISLGTPFSLWVAGMITKNDALKQDALVTFGGFVISQSVTFATKAIVNKPRPHDADPTLIALRIAKSKSFPSGHTSEAFANATSLTLITKKWYVAVPAYTWASLVGYSRLYLGVHYPVDVFAGAIVGTGSAWLSYKLNNWIHKSKSEKNKVAFLY